MNPAIALNFRPINPSESSVAKQWLADAALVIADLTDKVKLFGLFDAEDQMMALGGLETYGEAALLRSVCVPAQYRRQGYGQLLVSEIENYSGKGGIKNIYLLTTTAREFFLALGYREKDRETAPECIKNTSEFSGLCPSTAIFMGKNLS